MSKLKNKAIFGLSMVNFPYVDSLFLKISKFENLNCGVIPSLGMSPQKFCDSWVAKYAPVT